MPEIKISNNELIKPLLSVCIITYNHKDYISKAIESVLVQKTDFPFEIIIADDCSTDGTRELLLEYQNKYPGLIKLILQEKNVGIHQNWIDLLYAPETKYIAYFDGDDYWIDEDKLQVQVDYLEANDQCSGVFHESKILVEGQGFSERIFGSDTQDEINAEDTISKGALFHSSSFVFRRSSLVLPEWIKSVASGDMALYSIVAASGFLKKIPKVMSVYRKHSGGITETDFIKDSYHENRIKFLNYLNGFHQYKFNPKVEDIVSFHQNEIENSRKFISAKPNDKVEDNFIDLDLSNKNLDIFIIRTAIKNAVLKNLHHLKGELLDIGCGKMPYRKFILEKSTVLKYTGLDIEDALQYDESVKPDFMWDGKKMPFENDTYDCAIGTEVLEHCPQPEIIMSETYRVLKPEGVFFFTIPFLWPLHEVPYDVCRYTPFTIERLLLEAGFRKVELNATGGWHASLAQMLGLWVRRAPMNSKKRKIFSAILKPAIRYLVKIDKFSKIEFEEGQMITGLSGLAYK